jgi:hypothetical protein
MLLPGHGVQILVSFCNLLDPGAPALGLLDPHSLAFRVVELPPELEGCTGVTGLTASDRAVYAALQGCNRQPGSSLAVLDRAELSLLELYCFREIRDVHSLCFSGASLYAVSTGTDDVYELRLEDARIVAERPVWRPEADTPRADNNHLNGICAWTDDLLVSGLGKKNAPGIPWSDVRAASVVAIRRDREIAANIDHPHSVTVVNGTIAYCESQKRAVQVVGGKRARNLPGYTRGLCVAGGKLFVGTSVGRRVSRSTGKLNRRVSNPQASGAAWGLCSVSRLSLDKLKVEMRVDLNRYTQEIYDLLPVEGTGAWPVLPTGDD